MKPLIVEHISNEDLDLARMYLGQRIFPQAMSNGHIAIWLELGCGSRTMIGYGMPDAALAQANEALDELRRYMQHSVSDFLLRRSHD